MKKALIIIDIQKEFAKHIFNIETVIKNTQKLITYFKNKNWPVIYIQDFHTDKKDPEFKKFGCHAIEKTDGVEYVSELKPNKKDILIRKKRLSAFFGTTLDKLLKQKKIKEIYLCGVFTDYCVLATAIDGFMRDYGVYVVSDATSTTSRSRHNFSLKIINNNSAKVIKVNNLIKNNLCQRSSTGRAIAS